MGNFLTCATKATGPRPPNLARRVTPIEEDAAKVQAVQVSYAQHPFSPGQRPAVPRVKSVTFDDGPDLPLKGDEMEPMINRPDVKTADQPGPNRLTVLCFACCGCLCAVLVALMTLIALVMSSTSVEVESTRFTFWNYYVPQLQYLWAGQADTNSWTGWYRELASSSEPGVGLGPGPNTRTYYGWQDVKGMLEDFAVRIRTGTMKRHNELGMSILTDALWPETGTVVTGLSNTDHAIVRPYFFAALDGAEGAWDKNCDGSSCWNAFWLRRKFKDRFSSLHSFSRDDLLWMVSSVLHKIHLNLDIPDDIVKDFAALQRDFSATATFARGWFWESVLDSRQVLEAKRGYERRYREAIRLKWPQERWEDSPTKLKVLGSAMLDSMALIGAASVASTLEFLLALLFMAGEPGRSIRPLNLEDNSQLHNFIWETLRRYPPVVGVPRWITNDGAKTWKHQIASLFQALHDPIKFKDPLEYRLGRPGLNHEDSRLSIGWADFAMVNGDPSDPDSHSCPAKQLSFRIIAAFLQEFEAAGPWDVDDPMISLSSLGSSGFILRKQV